MKSPQCPKCGDALIGDVYTDGSGLASLECLSLCGYFVEPADENDWLDHGGDKASLEAFITGSL